MRTLSTRRGHRRAFSEHYARQVRVDDFRHTWRAACDWSGLAQHVRVPAGQSTVVPDLLDVAGHDPTVLMVRLLPGMLVADLAAQAPRLANALGGARLTATPVGTQFARLVLHRVDPLAAAFAQRAIEPDGFLGVTEDGIDLVLPWAQRVHSLFQGSTGSGKTTAAYGQLAPLAYRPDVQVVGLDPSGLVFAPWAGLPGEQWRVSGLAGNLEAHHRVLLELCAEMDRRLTLLPPGVDNLVPTPELPLLVVVFEELSGFLRVLDADRKLSPLVRALMGRLFAEGRKTGLRCMVIIPRADAAVLGAGIRDQCHTGISFACQPDGFRMLHPTTAGVDPDEHATAAPGIAVVTSPGLGTVRIRAGRVTYAEYCERVSDAPRPLHAVRDAA